MGFWGDPKGKGYEGIVFFYTLGKFNILNLKVMEVWFRWFSLPLCSLLPSAGGFGVGAVLGT